MMYRCLKEDLIYFENCVDFTFLFQEEERSEVYCSTIYTCGKYIVESNSTRPNDVGVEFYSNDRLGPMCRVPKLKAKSMQVNTMVYHSFGNIGPMLFTAVPKLVKSSISPESFKAKDTLQRKSISI